MQPITNSKITRRAFAMAALAIPRLANAAEEWQSLFDGSSLNGWTASENKSSWKVENGSLIAGGPRSHLFYTGPVHGADFRNFELELEAMAMPGANSGVYFHTVYQDQGFPRKGFEVQVNNTATGGGTYRERKKTGSLYGLRNVYKQIAADERWFKIQIAVRGKNIQVRVDGLLTVDYVEPTPPYIPKGPEPERFLDHGTFALQCHDPGSKARFRAIRARPLPDALAESAAAAPGVDDVFRDIIEIGRANVPLVDYDIQLKNRLTLDEVLSTSRRDGLWRSICVEARGDGSAKRFIGSARMAPVFVGLRSTDRQSMRALSTDTMASFDYVLADAANWGGTSIRDPQQFVDAKLRETIEILESQPIDICANVLSLPPGIANDSATLWTDGRLEQLFAALAKHEVAMQIGTRDRLPGAPVIQRAKRMGIRFTLGSGSQRTGDLTRCEYGLAMTKECALTSTNFWVPGGWGPKAVERKRGGKSG